jgi:tight adherence protein B
VRPLLISLAGAYGVFLLYTSLALGWQGVGVGPGLGSGVASRRRAEQWLVQAGLDDVRLSQFLSVMALLFLVATGLTFAAFGALLPAVAVGAFAATWPAASYRNRRRRRREKAAEGWPRMIEEIALLTGSLGRSIPQALFEVGRRGPEEMRGAFAAAHREWLLSTDFPRSVAVLKARLADATADAACETLLVAHDVGGADVQRRLAALVDDRIADLQGRKDARARQAGVRFARRFVLLVPLGMALVGLSIGDGRAAYEKPTGQVAAVVAVGMVVGCWVWSGRIMRLPEEERVFYDEARP